MRKMIAHLPACVASHNVPGPSHSLLLLRISARNDSRYWILVEARATATLQQLDALLRHVWLECCGHLSAFVVDRHELGMGTTLTTAFRSARAAFDYEYDFGSTTALTGELLSAREGSIGRSPVRLVARNEPIPEACAECDTRATLVCPYCIEMEDKYLFCDAHAATHEHADEEVYLPVVNSPRMGVCGYSG